MGRLLIAAAVMGVLAGGLISFGVAGPLLAQDAAISHPPVAFADSGN